MAEIGNRKERLRDYASFPEWQPHRNPVLKREAKKNKNQEAKRNLIPRWLLKTAAKRRREPEGEASSVGIGAKPQAGYRAATLTSPSNKRKQFQSRM